MTHPDTSPGLDHARAALSNGRPLQALQALAKRVQEHAEDAATWQLLGFAQRELQHMPEALVAFARAHELDATNPLTATALAQTRLETGLPAVDECRAALLLDAGRVSLIASLAAALMADGRREEAEFELTGALQRRPEWLEGQRLLATLRWTGGDREHYARGYDLACTVQPDNLALRLAWFRLLAQLRDWPAARALLAKAEKQFGAQRELLMAQLVLAAESGATAEAEALFECTREWRDEVREVAWIRHCLREGRAAQALDNALALTHTASARVAWPYLSLIWRLLRDSRAQWLDGEPPFIRSFDLDWQRGQLEELAEVLRRLHTARAPYTDQSVRGGTQTERSVFFRSEPILQVIRRRMLDAISEYIDGLPPPLMGHPLLGTPRKELLFAGSWSVRLAQQGFNVAHTHPLGWISSAFYVAIPDAATRGPRPAGWIRFGEAPVELALDLPPVAEIEPQPGRLVLFPATMWHGTAPFANGERLTLAFDVRRPTY